MNLQTTLRQSNFFPFGFGNSNVEKSFDNAKDNIPKQERELLEIEAVEPKRKENLILSREAIAIIGDNGKRRFDEFKKHSKGWYGGKGKKISEWSVLNFERFVKRIPELRQFQPSLFLTLEGNLELGWEDKNGQEIEIEFYPDKIEYFIESLNEEAVVALADIFTLTEKIIKLL